MASNPPSNGQNGGVDPNDWLMGGGARSAKFTNVGDYVMGFVVREPEVQPQTDMVTGEVKVWNNGDVRKQVRVILQTDQRDPEDPDDDGERAIYIRGQMRKAVQTAIKAVGAPGLQVGGKLTVRFIGVGPAAKNLPQGPKLYDAKYAAPAAAGLGPEPDAQPAATPVPAGAAAQATAAPAAAPEAPATQQLPPIPF